MSPVELTPPFGLSDSERASPLWQRLEAELIARLARKRAENDDPQSIMTEAKTERARGHIECLKTLIGLGKDWPPKVTAE